MAENTGTLELHSLEDHHIPKQQIALYGGAFNPIHVAHLRTAQYVLDSLHLHKLYLVPNASPPHKKDHMILSYEQRVELLQTALKDLGDPRIEISFLERDASVLHYTFDTLTACHKLYPDAELNFIMGMDSLLNLESWKRGLELVELANILILKRPSYPLDALPPDIKTSMEQTHKHHYILLDSPNYSFSSTEIRKALKALQTPKDKYDFSATYKAYLSKALTPNTLELILKNHYYC